MLEIMLVEEQDILLGSFLCELIQPAPIPAVGFGQVVA